MVGLRDFGFFLRRQIEEMARKLGGCKDYIIHELGNATVTRRRMYGENSSQTVWPIFIIDWRDSPTSPLKCPEIVEATILSLSNVPL